MPDVEKTVNIKINVDDAELSKIDTAEGKVRDMVDKLKEVKGGTFDIKPGGGGVTPSGKTPDRDPSFQMLRIINLTLNKILNQIRGDYIGAKRQTATGTVQPNRTEIDPTKVFQDQFLKASESFRKNTGYKSGSDYMQEALDASARNKVRNQNIDAANDWRKGIRGMITGALIDFHLLRVIGQSSHVVAASMDMLGKTMGLLLDVILLPFLPAIGILARGIATFATLLMSTNPIITAFKTALSVLIAAITTIVLIGAFKGGMTGGMFGAVRGGFGALRHGAGKILGRASGGPLAFGQTAIVGENGPEMLLPTSGGFHVVPNNQLRMLADGTDMFSMIGGGIAGGAIGYGAGKFLFGDTGAAIGAGLGAVGGAFGGSPLTNSIGQAASYVYGQPVVQGILSTMSTLSASINAVLAPLAPILGGAGGILLGAAISGRGRGDASAETTAKVGSITNKNISSMSYGVQNAVVKSSSGTNNILTLILLRLNQCFRLCPDSITGIGNSLIPFTTGGGATGGGSGLGVPIARILSTAVPAAITLSITRGLMEGQRAQNAQQNLQAQPTAMDWIIPIAASAGIGILSSIGASLLMNKILKYIAPELSKASGARTLTEISKSGIFEKMRSPFSVRPRMAISTDRAMFEPFTAISNFIKKIESIFGGNKLPSTGITTKGIEDITKYNIQSTDIQNKIADELEKVLKRPEEAAKVLKPGYEVSDEAAKALTKGAGKGFSKFGKALGPLAVLITAGVDYGLRTGVEGEGWQRALGGTLYDLTAGQFESGILGAAADIQRGATGGGWNLGLIGSMFGIGATGKTVFNQIEDYMQNTVESVLGGANKVSGGEGPYNPGKYFADYVKSGKLRNPISWEKTEYTDTSEETAIQQALKAAGMTAPERIEDIAKMGYRQIVTLGTGQKMGLDYRGAWNTLPADYNAPSKPEPVPKTHYLAGIGNTFKEAVADAAARGATYNITINSTAQNGDQLYNEFIRRMKQDGARIS